MTDKQTDGGDVTCLNQTVYTGDTKTIAIAIHGQETGNKQEMTNTIQCNCINMV